VIPVFGATGHIGGDKKYILTGPEALSYFDVARILSETVGRAITYVPLSLEEARARMTRAGDPPWAIESLLALAVYQRAGGPTAVVHDTVQKILARPPRSLAEFVKDHAKDFRGNEGTPEENH
jgi:NAD(P)H dehydrogenase (quinone)